MNLKSLFKIGTTTLLAHLFNNKTPISVVLSVTNLCPSRCKYCAIPQRNQKELAKEEIFSLLDELASHGTQRLGLSGGEPLIREDIGEIIDYAKGKGFYITLDSNGYLIPQKIDELKNLDLLIMSLDGPEEVHDKNREVGSYKKTIRALKIATKKLPVWTITVLTKNNLDSIDYILDLAKKINFFTTFQILHHNEHITPEIGSLLPSPEEYRKAIKKLIEAKKGGAPIVSSLSYFKSILRWRDYLETYRTERKIGDIPCWAGKLFCNVDTDGTVYPCFVFTEKMKGLNFLEVGFKKAFDNIFPVNCSSCVPSCLIEYNLIFSLYPGAIYNCVKYLCRKKNSN